MPELGALSVPACAAVPCRLGTHRPLRQEVEGHLAVRAALGRARRRRAAVTATSGLARWRKLASVGADVGCDCCAATAHAAASASAVPSMVSPGKRSERGPLSNASSGDDGGLGAGLRGGGRARPARTTAAAAGWAPARWALAAAGFVGRRRRRDAGRRRRGTGRARSELARQRQRRLQRVAGVQVRRFALQERRLRRGLHLRRDGVPCDGVQRKPEAKLAILVPSHAVQPPGSGLQDDLLLRGGAVGGAQLRWQCKLEVRQRRGPLGGERLLQRPAQLPDRSCHSPGRAGCTSSTASR